jgi:periplasmic divalent cation tolerance protein
MIYITVGSAGEARALGRTLVHERLAASANIIEGATSFFWWQGELQEASEALLVAKTKSALVPRVIARVKALHSYDCPCVLSLPVEDGNPDYLDWVAEETV